MTCKRCGFSTKYSSNLYKHLRKKVECQVILENIDRGILINEFKKQSFKIDVNDTKYICKFCKKEFNHSSNKSVHQRICKVKVEKIKNVKNIKNVVVNNNNVINNYYQNFNIYQITNIVQFNEQMLLPNRSMILSIGNYLVDSLVDNKCKLFIDCIKRSKYLDSMPNNKHNSDHTFILEILKVILLVDNPVSKNIFIDEPYSKYAYVFIDGTFYTIELNKLVELLCSHIPEIIKKLIKYKDTLDGLENDDLDYAKFTLSEYINNYLNKKDKEEFKQFIISVLIENKKLITEFSTKQISEEEFKLLTDNKLIYSINDDNLNKVKYLCNNNTKIENIPRIRSKKNINITENIIINSPVAYTDTSETDTFSNDTSTNDNDETSSNISEKKLFRGIECTKGVYNGIEIWINNEKGVGCLYNKGVRLMNKDNLYKKIDNMNKK